MSMTTTIVSASGGSQRLPPLPPGSLPKGIASRQIVEAGSSEQERTELVERHAEQCSGRQGHDPGEHDIGCHVPAYGGDLAGGTNSDDSAGDGMGGGHWDAQKG